MFYVDCKIYTPDDTNTELHTHKMFKIGKENLESSNSGVGCMQNIHPWSD